MIPARAMPKALGEPMPKALGEPMPQDDSIWPMVPDYPNRLDSLWPMAHGLDYPNRPPLGVLFTLPRLTRLRSKPAG